MLSKSIRNKYIKNNINDLKLGVFSWNIGDNINDAKIKKIKKLVPKNIDILVLGFQEVPVREMSFLFTKLKKNLINYTKILNSRACHGKFKYLVSMKYGICMFIFVKSNIKFDYDIKVTKQSSLCKHITGTKGFVVCTIKIEKKKMTSNSPNKKITIDIVNTHMPFKSIETTIEFEKKINNLLNNKNYKSDNRIIFGDINSRSLLTENCYEKNIELCDNKKSVYCKLSKKLELLSNKNSIGTQTKKHRDITNPKRQMKNDFKKNMCLKKDCSIKHVPQNNQKLINLLLARDVVGNPPQCKIFSDLNEYPIKFFPTYKRDIETGKFQLSKKNKNGRLPGYADRILYKTKKALIPTHYTSLDITGNDHLPILKLFKINL